MMGLGLCVVCGEQVETKATGRHEVTSWVESSGSKSSAGAVPTGRVMHRSCFMEQKLNKQLGHDQQAFF